MVYLPEGSAGCCAWSSRQLLRTGGGGAGGASAGAAAASGAASGAEPATSPHAAPPASATRTVASERRDRVVIGGGISTAHATRRHSRREDLGPSSPGPVTTRPTRVTGHAAA